MDRHEYEINQLINPKKDIVKSNSKHRDKIETLILGRRVEGIDGGGDTPEKTLWKAKADAYGYIFCETRGTDIMILSKNSQGDLPYVQENGKVFSFTSKTDAQIKTLLVDQLNAKGYNLPSSGWLEELTTLKKGDSVPNWNEYQEL